MIYSEEMAYFRAPTRDASTGTDLVGPTLMIFGTDEQKAEHLPGIADASAVYCQGFSEPESGSDLASLQLRAVEDGDDYVLNGSKIWTSGAHRASHFYLMARTDPEAPKHRGISVFILDMDAPGLDVQPITNMFGVHYFNQVFFENVRVPKRNMIGEKNRGWYVAATTLDFERSGVARYAGNQRALEELAELAREVQVNGQSLAENPVIRKWIAELYVSNEAGRSIAYNVGWMQSQGLVPNREASVSKMMGSEISQKIRELGIRMAGMFGTLDKGSKWAYYDGRLALEWMDSISLTIRGGTSEIQRNIIATRGLGLPRG
jgi:alkylation response protein AidB-like acyl-CoA dehydrogenase